ncbi:TPA: YebC/PmpR family DNA-binding transcriptional regulator [Patescibacteria group bacterium]|nr:MAG: transcriptional regulator [Parcubacteria group bacterium GW2011_GWA1_Parcubacteria_45_10]KKT88016.1 MAG: transcriptional regulator [Parcubacteria group bacterium GW2011_GWB1_45_10]HCI05341.1 YebC/PmpR family DNA-binding transcriptional regulator [Patescibacteria group bacterium]
MSGHSKWAKLKHSKPLVDAKKSKNFSKHSNLIAIAAKQGGNPDPKLNPYLKEAIENSRQVNLPQDNIERAIKRGLGLIPGIIFEELTIEAYGPEGVALIIKAATDNKNRTIPEIRKILSQSHGSIADSGSVLWLFQEIGRFEIDKSVWDKNSGIELEVIDAGATDVFPDENSMTVLTGKESFENLKKLFRSKSVNFEAELGYQAATEIEVKNKDAAEKIIQLVENLEERDDVGSVYTNAKIE